jgi:hypothetical protein
VLLVLIVVLVGVLIVADRVAVRVAEQRISEVVMEEARTQNVQPASASVKVTGFPFLTQVASGRYDGGEVLLRDLRTTRLTIDRVDIDVSDLRVPSDVLRGAAPHDITAERLRGNATVTLDQIATGIGLKGLKLTGDGSRVKFTVPVTFASLQAEVTGLAKVRLEGSRVWLEVSDVTAAGFQVPRNLVDSVTAQLTTGITLPAMPFSLRLTGVNVAGSAVRVSAAADRVNLVA